MFKKRILPVLLVLFMFTECENDGGKVARDCETGVNGTVTVYVADGVPGCFVAGDKKVGYPYDLLGAYAYAEGLSFESAAEGDAPGLSENHEKSGMGIEVVLAADVAAGEEVLPLYTSGYLLLGRGRSDVGTRGLVGTVGAGRVVMPVGFERCAGYDMVLDSLSGAELYVSADDAVDMAAAVVRGDYDFMVCDDLQAGYIRIEYAGLEVLYNFSDKVEVCAILDGVPQSFRNGLVDWLAGFRGTDEYVSLLKSYEYGYGVERLIGDCRISAWDDVLREVGREEGVDWRLLAAIAYKESRFSNDVVSKMGARGLMQIMPVTARHFDVDVAQLGNPRVNVMLAAKLIKSIERTLGFGENVDPEDKIMIVLAGYNSGVGTVGDARRLAAACGGDPDSWDTVARYLRLMGDSSFECDAVDFRRFRGAGETLAFVEGVKSRYDVYRSRVI